ncbi:hypothetical protein HOLleu_22774 [Holothuria leucospilota]|uniref:C2H2-type domain-containing protein n=1 Tax=Holothuria leucospilota TaxID=206669 RepID=A0A9Q1H2F9_HOLLE|nr:hypothetical protein HOLleu_22774 [Holothuria leucospilota]
MVSFACCHCVFTTKVFTRLLKHYRYIHSAVGTESNIRCNIQGCQWLSRNVRTFRIHIKNRHKDFWETHGKIVPIQNNSCEEDLQSDNDDPLDVGEVRENAPECDDPPQEDCELFDAFKEASQFILGLREQYKLSDQSCSYIAEEVSDILGVARNKIHVQVRNVLVDNIEEDQFHDLFEKSDLEYAFEHFSNVKRLKSYVKVNYDFVEPIEYVLGRYSSGKPKCMQYVSVLKTLQALLKRDDVFAEVIQGHNMQNGTMGDYCDSLNYQNSKLFSGVDPTLQIHLGNIPPKYRSKLHFIQLVGLCPTEFTTEFGMTHVLAPLIDDIKVLEATGVDIEKAGNVHNFKGSVSMIVGDNLAAHTIGGYQESFHCQRICRFCMIVQDDLKSHFRDTHLVPRTKESYDAQVEIVERMPEMAGVYGLKRNSVCNQLKYFHVINGQPPDIAHDLFEGVVPDVMERVILHCVSEGYFSLQYLNDQVENFPFEGFDKTNKPSKMATQISKFKVKQKAVQMWCFLRLLPLLVGDKVPIDDDLWDLVLLLADIVEICTASQVNAALCEFLGDLIESFLKLYFSHFPDVSMKPKFHYLIHYPKLMLQYGPLIHCWTLRYEGKHMYFKELSYRTKNRQNMCKTLATRHEYYNAWMRSKITYLVHDNIEHTCGSLTPVRTLFNQIQQLLYPLLGRAESVYTVKKVRYDGTWYSQGCTVAVGFTQEKFVEFALVEICCIIAGEVFIVCQKAVTEGYRRHFNAFELTLGGAYIVKRITDLLDYYPLSVYQIAGHNFVTLRHRIEDNHY